MEGQSGTPWAAWRQVPVGREGLQELLALQPTPELRIQSSATAQVLELLDVAGPTGGTMVCCPGIQRRGP